ncbi:hypothetical protein K6W81_20895 [Enterobacter sp. MW07]|nr:hypothetical protein [Enterobacter sp. MW07]
MKPVKTNENKVRRHVKDYKKQSNDLNSPRVPDSSGAHRQGERVSYDTADRLAEEMAKLRDSK